MWILILSSLVFSCSKIPDKPWYKVIPGYAPAVLVFADSTTLSQALQKKYMSFFDDLSGTAIPVVQKLTIPSSGPIMTRAMILFPEKANRWTPVWVASGDHDLLKSIDTAYTRAYSQQKYLFHDIPIRKLFLKNLVIYITRLNHWILFSESSYGIEESIRAYLGLIPALDVKRTPLQPGTLVLNAGHLDRWVNLETGLKYRPMVEGAFQGLKPVDLHVSSVDTANNKRITIKATVPLGPDSTQTALIRALSGKPRHFELLRYIPSDAAAFALMQAPEAMRADTISHPTAFDSLLQAQPALYQQFKNTLDPEWAFVTFDPGGFLSVGENIFIRRLKDASSFEDLLSNLADENIIQQTGSGYYIRSRLFARLLGTPLCTYSTFYAGTTGASVVLAPRLGLVTRLQSDWSHRRVMYYSDYYKSIRRDFPEETSAFFFVQSGHFQQYIKSYLHPTNTVSAITTQFETLGASLTREGPDKLSLLAHTYSTHKSNRPYRERWVFSTDGSPLSGEPAMGNLGGNAHNELVVATKGGEISILAADGSILNQMATIGDTPVGSPVIYDWYGNGRNAVLIASGNKIYAWNANGDLLPKFPIILNEAITSPLAVADVTRDGIPELIVATADRKLHVLNGLGKDIPGWPVETNTIITHKPAFTRFQNEWSVWAVAGNALFAWNRYGSARSGFPVFAPATLSDTPVFADNQLLLGAANGYLYTIGPKRMLSDSLNAYRNAPYDTLDGGRLHMGALYVGNSAIVGQPVVRDLDISIDSVHTEHVHTILTGTDNGSVFLFKTDGKLLFTENMGQPMSDKWAPHFADFNYDNHDELVTLASFGRLYAWNLTNRSRLFNLPTASMSYPVITDLDGDGDIDVIAGTREGVRMWTIMPPPRQPVSSSVPASQ